jgi:predicted permease
MPGHLQQILLNILAPIVLMIALGAMMGRKYRVDLASLSKINIYLFVPAFVFDKISNSQLAWADMGGIVAITILQVATLGAIVWGIGRVLGIGRKTLAAIAVGVMFYNSGNYGLPLAQLVYRGHPQENLATGAQAFVVMTQNVMTFTVGMAIAAWAHHGGVGKGFATLLRMPVLPTLAAALLSRAYIRHGGHLPIFISQTARFLSDGLVPLALVTLGVQLASNPRWPRWKPISLVILLRLVFGPVQMGALLLALHWAAGRFGGVWRTMDLWPMPAELLIVTAAVPTAVNTLLVTLELDGDAELAADCVFWTTVVSCVTIAVWLMAVPPTMRWIGR